MEVRRFDRNDTQQLCDIYYNSIHHVNKADYTQEELEAWAPSGKNTAESLEKDTKRWQKIMPFVAVKEDVCLGFAELEDGGHINCFFVSHCSQGRGVGSALMQACIAEAKKLEYTKIAAEVSITAKPFFMRKGFAVVEPLLCEINGIRIKYYAMELIL